MYNIYHNDRLLMLSDKWDACTADSNAIICKDIKKSDISDMVRYFLGHEQVLTLVLLCNDLPALFDAVRAEFCYHEAAGGLVHNAVGEALMIFRNNRWDLPKGHREAGESAEETALREVEEECGISNLQLLRQLTTTFHIYREAESVVLKRTDWYAMRYEGAETLVPQTGEGIERAEWIASDNLSALVDGSYKTIAQVFEAAKNAS